LDRFCKYFIGNLLRLKIQYSLLSISRDSILFWMDFNALDAPATAMSPANIIWSVGISGRNPMSFAFFQCLCIFRTNQPRTPLKCPPVQLLIFPYCPFAIKRLSISFSLTVIFFVSVPSALATMLVL